ncbi:LamG-like jellyroll fold domain-containing protein [Kitasatospora sp. NPDC094016]|uniref:LamG-like jellyroll fold domain-containing protein n=1 Tax=Kitasatospora sp. NPDC094016 TaxID=3154986 RepID=UPI00332650D6
MGSVAGFKDGVLTLAAPGAPAALAAGELVGVGGSVYVLAEAVEEQDTELRLTYGPASAAIAAGTAVERLSYDPRLVTHTRPGASAVYGSRYVSASVVSTAGATTGSVTDGEAAVSGQARPPRWWGDLPGRALSFAATTAAPTLEGARLASARHADDLTIEAWLKPVAGTTATDTPRVLHANTGAAADDSQYVLALGPSVDRRAGGERPLVMGVGNRFVTSRATIPVDRWTHVAGAFEQSWALRFANGVYAQAPHADDLNIGRDLTLEVFLQTDALGSAQGLLSRGRVDDGRGRRVPYQLGIAADGKLVFSFEGRDGKEVRLTSTGAVEAGKFQRVAVVRKLGDIREEKTGQRTLSVTDAQGKPAQLIVNAIESLVIRQWSDITFYIDGAESGNIRYADAPTSGTPEPWTSAGPSAARRRTRSPASSARCGCGTPPARQTTSVSTCPAPPRPRRTAAWTPGSRHRAWSPTGGSRRTWATRRRTSREATRPGCTAHGGPRTPTPRAAASGCTSTGGPLRRHPSKRPRHPPRAPTDRPSSPWAAASAPRR